MLRRAWKAAAREVVERGELQRLNAEMQLELLLAMESQDCQRANRVLLHITKVQRLELLQKQMAEAIANSHFGTACEIQDQINAVQGSHKAVRVERCTSACSHMLKFRATKHYPCCGEPSPVGKCQKLARGDAMRVVRALDDGTPVGAVVVLCGQDRDSSLAEIFTGARFFECAADRLVRVLDHDWSQGSGAAHTGEYRIIRDNRGWLLNGPNKGDAINIFCGLTCAHGGDPNFFLLSHFSCCGQRALDSPCARWVIHAPHIGVRDRVRTVTTGECGVVLINDRSQTPLLVRFERGGEAWFCESELEKVMFFSFVMFLFGSV